MKRSVLVLSMTALMLVGGMNIVKAQEQPAPKKDTVNMDTDAKPQFYFPIEDEKVETKGGSGTTIAIVGGAVVLAGAAGFILLRKKK